MNVHRPLVPLRSRLTSKGQVTVPKDIRDALGLRSGDLINFTRDDAGTVFIERADEDDQLEHRMEQIAAGVREARRAFKAENCLPDGMTSDQWYEMMRGPPAEV
jgi:AbrB family looped-hinge helix DNA binding protein